MLCYAMYAISSFLFPLEKYGKNISNNIQLFLNDK